MRLWVSLTCALGLAWSSTSQDARAQDDSFVPSGAIPGLVEGQMRTYLREDVMEVVKDGGTLAILCFVLRFDSMASAAGGMMAIEADTNSSFAEVNVPLYADDARAFREIEKPAGDDSEVAMLVIIDGVYVHLWVASGPRTDPLSDLLTVADNVFKADNGARSTAAPSEGTKGQLPRDEDLPPGFTPGGGGSFPATPVA